MNRSLKSISKKKSVVIVLLVLLLAFMTACSSGGNTDSNSGGGSSSDSSASPGSNGSSGGNRSNPIKVTFWHSMGGEVGQAVDHLVAEFNKSRSDIQVEAIYQGSYDESLSKMKTAMGSCSMNHP